MGDFQSQVVGLHNDLRAAVDVDPKAPLGAATKSLLRRMAEQAKSEARNKRAAEMVVEALSETVSVGMSVADAFALTGQLVRALKDS